MRRFLSGVLLLSFLLPQCASAEQFITRRDGFLQIWESIRRPADETSETPFLDVPEGAAGFREITFAKRRGILDADDESFHPDQPLQLSSALLWLFRTRSVDDLDTLKPAAIPSLLVRYPLGKDLLSGEGSGATLRDRPLTQEQLLTLMRTLDALLGKEVHEVSLYSEKFQGKGTAFGESFDMYAMTAAHRTFPYNTLVRVTNVENGQSVTVRINDRGPFVKGRDMDLSLGAFTTIAPRSKGKILATFQRLGDANMVGPCSQELRLQRRITRDVLLNPGVPWFMQLGTQIDLSSDKAFVVYEVTYPDGNTVRPQDWVLPGEHYRLIPSVVGTYTFLLRTISGRGRAMATQVVQCAENAAPQ